ncbi:hypothetical protein L6164_022491 [Bauhinia variegata]|uniref:Uncharacterized protein n=1 Tax=Bauhinia variegata TaxID=167791 RepID=A0ACB9MIQ6_BAUVA|nr:hypothetical protein L6164_022491 [Bauhinia variegata]
MAIQVFMGFKKASFCILSVLLLLTSAVSLKDKDETKEEFLSQLLDPTSGLLDEDTAELLWTSCRADLIHLEKEVEDLKLCFPEESSTGTDVINPEIRSLVRDNFQKLITAHHPQLRQILLQCLRKNNLPFQVSGEDDGSKIRHFTFLELFFSRSNVPRRNLALELPQRSPKLSPPSTQSSHRVLKSKSSKKKKADKQSDHEKLIILAVVVTASVTFVLAALLFVCCSMCCRTGRDSKNDEKPLLSLSMSDYSVGSSNNAFGNSMKEENFRFQSSSNDLLNQQKTSSFDGTTLKESASIGANAAARPSFELKPPPGRVVPSGLPPLKPPPGRPDLLPPQPPFVVNAPPSSPPPPPPPPTPPPAQPQTVKPPLAAGAPPPPGAPAPPPPPIPRGSKPGGPRPPGPPPPPAPRGARPGARVPPIGRRGSRRSASGRKVAENIVDGSQGEAGVPKTKLKPFFWDKVQANSEQAMVWSQLKAGSFQFNEEMIETLFGYTATDKSKVERKKDSAQDRPQYMQIIEVKKAQNLSILLKALNVTTEEVCDALLEGNELPSEFLQTLLKMAPTSEEELKLRLYSGPLTQLGPADRFLKALVEIPFAFKRLETLLFMGTLEEDLSGTMESFDILEVACKELKNSRLFLKLLEAVLKTGNRMNDGTFRGGAMAFKLDTLLKLSDVKGVDGKTTLLHFVVQEISRGEGVRAARMARESKSFSSIKTEDLLEDITTETEEHFRELGLGVVSRLSSELENIKKAAAIDADSLTSTTAKLGHGLLKTRDFVNTELKSAEGDKGFYETVESFVESAEDDVKQLLEEEQKIMALVKSTGDYFHGNAGKDEGLRLFVVVRDFLIMLDKVCREVRERNAQNQKKPTPAPAPAKTQKPESNNKNKHKNKNKNKASRPSDRRPPSDLRDRLFPQIKDRRMDDFSSDDDSD